MKYLGIHKVLWLIVIVIVCLMEFIFLYLLPNILSFLWCFKFNTSWESMMTYEVYNKEKHCIESCPYGDKNIFQTIKRRYSYTSLREKRLSDYE